MDEVKVREVLKNEEESKKKEKKKKGGVRQGTII